MQGLQETAARRIRPGKLIVTTRVTVIGTIKMILMALIRFIRCIFQAVFKTEGVVEQVWENPQQASYVMHM